MADPQTIFRARSQGARALVHGESINVDGVVDLLVDGAAPSRHPAIRRNANALLEELARAPWRITAGPHTGGFGGRGRPPDATRHITVGARRGVYHLRQDGRGHLFEITGPGMEGLAPWASPGSPSGK